MDCSSFSIKPFSSVSLERKMSNVIIAGLLPMLDRQLTIVLAVEFGAQPFYPAWLSRMMLGEKDLWTVLWSEPAYFVLLNLLSYLKP
jgi:hypothetical protein